MAAPTVDNTGQSVGGTSISSLTITSFAVGAGSNRLLVAIPAYYTEGGTVSSVAFNTSTSLTKQDANSAAMFGGTGNAELWYAKAPPNTTASIVFTFSSTANEVVCGALSFADVDQTTPFGAMAKNTGSSSSTWFPTVTVTSTTDAIVIDGVWGGDNGSAPVATGTQSWSNRDAPGDSRGLSQRKAGGTSVTMDWTTNKLFGFVNFGVGVNGGGSPPPSSTVPWPFFNRRAA